MKANVTVFAPTPVSRTRGETYDHISTELRSILLNPEYELLLAEAIGILQCLIQSLYLTQFEDDDE